MTIRQEYLDTVEGHPESFLVAATNLTVDLMHGDPETFKSGYTRDNAALAAADVFPEVDAEQVVTAIAMREQAAGAWEEA